MLSPDEALCVAKEFAAELDKALPGKILAVYAVGSLGGGYYRPGQSDIDTVVVTNVSRGERLDIKPQVNTIAARYGAQYRVPKGFGAVIFAEEQLFPPYVKEEELIQEILRLKTQGWLLYGQYDVGRIPWPDWEAVRRDVLNFQEWADTQKGTQLDKTSLINSTLLALKRYLLLGRHIVEFNKFKVIDLYRQNDPPLVDEEVFGFIQDELHGRPTEWNEDTRKRYTSFHDELYRVINDRVLYNDGR